MTQLLASVLSTEEARIALDCGTDIIDCKDPSAGALGALPNATVRDIVALVKGRRPVSATIGDLPMEPTLICEAVKLKVETGVNYIKVGIFLDSSRRRSLSRHALSREPVSSSPVSLDSGPGLLPAGADPRRNDGVAQKHLEECFELLRPFSSPASLIAVLFADQQPDLKLLPALARSGFAGVMLDTADKGSGGLTHHASRALLAQFVRQAKGLGLMAGLAGSLKREDIPPLLELEPDYLGFRGALCARRRSSRLEPSRILGVKQAISAGRRTQRDRTRVAQGRP